MNIQENGSVTHIIPTSTKEHVSYVERAFIHPYVRLYVRAHILMSKFPKMRPFQPFLLRLPQRYLGQPIIQSLKFVVKVLKVG